MEYGTKLKLHIGVLLIVGGFYYYVPISSAKPKHHRMSNSLDFLKLQDNSTGYLYAVLNINNMIPVPSSCVTQLKYNQIESFCTFGSEKEDVLQRKAQKLYQKCIANPNSSLAEDAATLKCWRKNASLILIHKDVSSSTQSTLSKKADSTACLFYLCNL